MRTNKDKVIKTVVSGVIRHPAWPEGLEANRAGGLSALPGCGGITYDIKAGDSAYGWAADHLEPGASTHNPDEKERMCYYTVCCMGNKAEVIGGNAEGAEGYVVAKHAGAWHVVIEFDQRDLREMHIKDQVQVVAYGTGLKLLDYPDVHVNSIDPECLEAMDIEEKDGKLHVPVAGVVPAVLMGSGMGSSRPMGDVDFMTSDWEHIKRCGLHELKLGDIVMVNDIDTSYGAKFQEGAASIGIIVHGDSVFSGHGPGITFFMASAKPLLIPVIDKTANIRKYHDKAYGPIEPMKRKKVK